MARASSRSPSADRLVVFVHQNDRPLPGALVQGLDQLLETGRRIDRPRFEAGAPLRRRQLPFHGRPDAVRDDEIAPAEAEPHDRMARRPVPLAVHGEAPEQLLAPLEQLLQRVHQEGLAEPARTRQEIVIAPFDKAAQMLRLVDVVAVPRPDFLEGGHADRKHAFHHPGRVGRHAGAVKESAVARVDNRRYDQPMYQMSVLERFQTRAAAGGTTAGTEEGGFLCVGAGRSAGVRPAVGVGRPR